MLFFASSKNDMMLFFFCIILCLNRFASTLTLTSYIIIFLPHPRQKWTYSNDVKIIASCQKIASCYRLHLNRCVNSVIITAVLLTMSAYEKDCQTMFVKLKEFSFLKISLHDSSFTSDHFIFHFSLETHTSF